jgi:hypothetical protein
LETRKHRRIASCLPYPPFPFSSIVGRVQLTPFLFFLPQDEDILVSILSCICRVRSGSNEKKQCTERWKNALRTRYHPDGWSFGVVKRRRRQPAEGFNIEARCQSSGCHCRVNSGSNENAISRLRPGLRGHGQKTKTST